MQRSGRSFFRRLDDDRASGRQRAADLAGGLAKRKVPRREGCDRTDWLSDHHVPRTRLARYDPAVGALTLCGIPLEELATTNDLETRLLEGLTMLQSDRERDLIDSRSQKPSSGQHDLGTVGRCRAAPQSESRSRGLECCL